LEEKAVDLLKKAEGLNKHEKEVLRYFINNVSVGDLRAVLDLKAKGVPDPEVIIAKLIREGFIEKGEGCYNLAKPLRELVAKKRIQI